MGPMSSKRESKREREREGSACLAHSVIHAISSPEQEKLSDEGEMRDSTRIKILCSSRNAFYPFLFSELDCFH